MQTAPPTVRQKPPPAEENQKNRTSSAPMTTGNFQIIFAVYLVTIFSQKTSSLRNKIIHEKLSRLPWLKSQDLSQPMPVQQITGH